MGDLNGFRAMENPPSTVPLDLLPTSDQPDIVFVREDREIIIIKRMVLPFNFPDSINIANNFKTSKYQILLSGLEARGYVTNFGTVEVGTPAWMRQGNWQPQHLRGFLWPGERSTGTLPVFGGS